MKVKNKLRLGFGFLFIVVLFFGATAVYYIHDISENSKVILQNNYESLSFARQMRDVLDNNDFPLNNSAINKFNIYLEQQETNITEPGEAFFTHRLRTDFRLLMATPEISVQHETARNIRKILSDIENLNMQAIIRKDNKARASVANATLFLGLVGGFTFLVLFSFSVNFPGFISKPLNTLLIGIRAIGLKNYKQRIHFDKNDEFAEVANAFNDMAERLDEWENSNLSKIMSSKLRIETIIEQMHEAIIGVNEKQELLFVNTAAMKILNLNAQKIEGASADDISKNNELFRYIINEATNIKPLKIVVDGKDCYFQMESREINVPNISSDKRQALTIAKNSAGKVYILRNITEFKERDEAKTNFIATISHELKTPISSIKMSLKLLKDERVGHINTEQQQLLEHIKDDNDRLLKITSELLELSQVETGNIQLNFVPVQPQEIVDYAITSVKFQAEQKGVKLEVVNDAGLPQVNVDVEKTAWVLVNFLSNALRYSAEKSKVIISTIKKGNEVEFSVKDFGKGIDEQYQKRLFDRYFQVPTDGQNKSGSGLGLAISKDFIEAQNGRIWLKSAIGEGSTFGFSLPSA
ncbi:ATP-binding protein [Mucilaginibacter sp. AK015]|uniref:ATP-binding protein n=1 Tax=Mucilaginibacter sp. AK015 TaxID=2723072 RepID=UPI0016172798|nr:ATP-binding protein [Mucilaginibacter sp. AK015]MBB5397019.1 signal transduction histidine kinase [Mucilaginibacter sp. AK015]